MSETAFEDGRALEIARSGDLGARVALAARRDVRPELLYFMAEDAAAEVRRIVAGNPATPRQADLILSQDPDAGVRCLLARKIVGDGLDGDRRSQLWRMGFTILETLMRDNVVRVRHALADALKHMFAAPHDIVAGLARDPDARVAAPVLRHSPVLSDDDLVDIVADGAPNWAHQAIAARATVSERVCDALVEAGADPTVTRLLRNDDADIGEPALERIVARAPEVEQWHEPLVNRPSLPQRLVGAIASFVGAPLAAAIRERGAKAAATATAESGATGGTRVGWTARGKRSTGAPETPKDRALRLRADGKLNDAVIEMAFNANEREFVLAALALRAGVPLWGVERIINSANGRAVTALCWKAGLQMRFAIEVQRRLARVPPSRVIHARDGFDYPFSEEDMAGRLELLLA